MIAAELLLDHELTGATADLAYSMITRSDDDAANVCGGRPAGRRWSPGFAAHYGISGSAPQHATRPLGEHARDARGLVQLYAKLRTDPTVWPGSGTRCGTPAGSRRTATISSSEYPPRYRAPPFKRAGPTARPTNPADAIVNTTGFVDHDRYAVAILTEGNANNDGSDDQGFTRTSGRRHDDGAPGLRGDR